MVHATTSPPNDILPMNGRVFPKKRPDVSILDGIVENSRTNTSSIEETGVRPALHTSATGCETMILRGRIAAITITMMLNQRVAWSVNHPLLGVNRKLPLRQNSCRWTMLILTTRSMAIRTKIKNRDPNRSGKKLRLVNMAVPPNTTANQMLSYLNIRYELRNPSIQAAEMRISENGIRSVLMPPLFAAAYQTSSRVKISLKPSVVES